MRDVLRGALLVAVVGGAGVAHADRISEASSIFSNECARCHSAEKLRPKTSTYREPPAGRARGGVATSPSASTEREYGA